ncbi:MAG: ABC transporter ATP-binding protein/permease [Candidatus Omnitrophica bacterium]|nr:ABC transporter ATP-binding protein/permease [Candidatus Omnitrophota bacterium]
MTSVLKYFRYLRPFLKKEILILLLSGASAVLGLVNPYLTKLIIDRAFVQRDITLFLVLAGIGGFTFILNGVFQSISSYLSSFIRVRINLQLASRVFKKLQRVPYYFFQDSSTGEILYRINYDVDQVTSLVSDTLPNGIRLLPRVILTVLIIIRLDWKMAVLSFTLAPFLFLLPYYFNRKLSEIFKLRMERSQGVFQRLQEVFSRIQLVKALGKESQEVRRYLKGLLHLARLNLKAAKWEAGSIFANDSIGRIVLGLIICYGAYQVIQGKMTLGTLSAVSLYLSQLAGLHSSFVAFFRNALFGNVSGKRLEKILDAPDEHAEGDGAKAYHFDRAGIEFQDLHFSYKPGAAILENISFSIPGGSISALVGPSGCGKTTIINLILRLFHPQKGQICIDGKPLTMISANSLKEQVCVALQEPYLWNDTLGYNITYANPLASPQEIGAAIEIACLDELVRNLPQGLETVIGENACKLSEGQKQRVSIARAILARPRILILDEGMSSVDSAIEQKILAGIRRALPDATVLIVSHRLSTVASCQFVYFFKNSRHILHGVFNELIDQDQELANFFSAQRISS